MKGCKTFEICIHERKKNSFRVHRNYNFYPFAYNFYPYFAASRTWTHAFPCNTKCGNCTAIPTLQRNQAGQYSWRRYRRWEPKAHPGTHMDYHPSLPCRKFIYIQCYSRKKQSFCRSYINVRIDN